MPTTTELAQGARFTMPDGRVGRVGRCRYCGAETVFALDERTRRTRPYDLDGVVHALTCADRVDETES